MLGKVQLGATGMEVTELCFGTLPMGPLQKNMSAARCVEVLAAAMQAGITFFDTAELYDTQEYLGQALARESAPVMVATKSTAESYQHMQDSVEKSFRELNRDYIDIFHLHAARADVQVFEQRQGALECLQNYRSRGRIGAVGIAAHNVRVVEAAAEEPAIEVVFALVNQAGRGLLGGDVQEMIAAMGKASRAGKGVYAMKALAGGHLLGERRAALEFVRQIDGNHATAVGMVSQRELDYNLALFSGAPITEALEAAVPRESKRLHISVFCSRCGACVEACPNGALVLGEEKAQVDHQRCLLCGYCSPVCPEFAIRLV